ncbi:MAG: cysteine desulfurase NifS [Candidatus Altiarchaeota archaeon]
MRKVYLDHAATSPVLEEVIQTTCPYFNELYGNASSLHQFGRKAKEALENAREQVSGALGAEPDEIYFNSGGSESDNQAIIGTFHKKKDQGNHIIISEIEHPAILDSAKYLNERFGAKITLIPVDSEGIVDPNDVQETITKDTILVSIMHANNEIGTIQPIEEIGKILSDHQALFHTDAVQTYGKIPVNVEKLGVDLLSISAHKLGGPKGVGALYIKKETEIDALIHGGGHERKMRSGTENVAGIVGLAKATEIASKNLKKETDRQIQLRDTLIKSILQIEDSWLNGHPTKRLPNNANFGFKYIEGEGILLKLDMKGIAASTGSACSSHSLEPSHVLTAIGLSAEDAHGSLRLTLGPKNTKEDISYAIETVTEVVEQLRSMSPFSKSNPYQVHSDQGH